MEYINSDIVNLEIVIETNDIDNTEVKKIVITYDNEQKEELIVCNELYNNIRKMWLIDQPPFISDRFKSIMNNIILGCIYKNERCIHDLNAYFSVGNEENVKSFFDYMRHRDLTEEKKKWRVIS